MDNGVTQNVPDAATYKYIISGMAGFITVVGYGAYQWIRSILKELNEEKTGRLNDLRESFKDLKNKN